MIIYILFYINFKRKKLDSTIKKRAKLIAKKRKRNKTKDRPNDIYKGRGLFKQTKKKMIEELKNIGHPYWKSISRMKRENIQKYLLEYKDANNFILTIPFLNIPFPC